MYAWKKKMGTWESAGSFAAGATAGRSSFNRAYIGKCTGFGQ